MKIVNYYDSLCDAVDCLYEQLEGFMMVIRCDGYVKADIDRVYRSFTKVLAARDRGEWMDDAPRRFDFILGKFGIWHSTTLDAYHILQKQIIKQHLEVLAEAKIFLFSDNTFYVEFELL